MRTITEVIHLPEECGTGEVCLPYVYYEGWEHRTIPNPYGPTDTVSVLTATHPPSWCRWLVPGFDEEIRHIVANP